MSDSMIFLPLLNSLRIIQVGAVYDSVNTAFLEGQYISAGYSGHGMPRAFGWYTPSDYVLHPSRLIVYWQFRSSRANHHFRPQE